VAPVKEAIQNRRRGGIVTEKPPPIVKRSIWTNRRAFSGGVTVQNNIQQIVSALFRYLLAQKQVVNDQEIRFGEESVYFFSPFELVGLEEVLKKIMGFPVDDFITGFNGGLRYGFNDMAFPVMESFP